MENIVDRNVAIANQVFVISELAVAINAKLDIITIPATHHAVMNVGQKGVLCHQVFVKGVDMDCMACIVQTNVVNVKRLHVVSQMGSAHHVVLVHLDQCAIYLVLTTVWLNLVTNPLGTVMVAAKLDISCLTAMTLVLKIVFIKSVILPMSHV